MKRNYKISDIRKALDVYQQKHHNVQTITLPELEQLAHKVRTPLIYNIDELIRLLSDYIVEHQNSSVKFYKEHSVCEILHVTKLTMHQWRTNGYIRFGNLPPKLIFYNLTYLLVDLKNIRDKNIS